MVLSFLQANVFFLKVTYTTYIAFEIQQPGTNFHVKFDKFSDHCLRDSNSGMDSMNF